MDFSFSPDEIALRARVRRFARETLAPMAEEADESGELSPGVTEALAKEGLFRYMIPEPYGGTGILVTNVCIIREELSKISSKADATFAMQGLGSYPITLAGSEEQRRRYLPAVATGEAIAAFAITEPHAGSDVASMRSTAQRDGDDYLLNGSKRYISNAGEAAFYCTFAKTDRAQGSRGISAFIVDRDAVGFELAEKIDVLAPHALGEIAFRDCRLPRTQLLGQEGQGIKIALSTLDVFRTTVGACVLGMAEAAYEAAAAYAGQRTAFGQALVEFQATQFKLAEMATNIEAARYLVYRAAWLKDQGQEQVMTEASMAKLFATEMAQKVVDDALQIHGAAGLVKGAITEKLYREVRQPRIYEGSSEILKITIARQIIKDAAKVINLG